MLQSGTRIGSFEIIGSLGAGGMGEVYRARDTRLDRDVALKVLPDAFASDPERLARFEREAKALAALNHPHIAQIHGIEAPAGTSGSPRAIVLELVEGPTLADRIAQGPLALEEALPVARQIAEALEAAHERNIIHRDLKPANIKVRSDGTVKVLDFGLAKALASSTGGALGEGTGFSVANSPTMANPATMQGIVLGTAGYMAPEQARGKDVDRRADIWAFGVVLFEMLAGRALFAGETTVDVLGAVMRQPIDLGTLPPQTPRNVRRVLKRCLERDPRQRLHAIADARIELDDASEPAEGSRADAPVRPTGSRGVALAGWGVALVSLAIAGSLWAVGGRTQPLAQHGYHFSIPQPPSTGGAPVVSPDGRHLVYAAAGRLMLRALDQVDLRPLEGTEGGRAPFWAPDSRAIGFFAGEALKRISIAGGPPATLATIAGGWAEGSWSSNGSILIEVTEHPGARPHGSLAAAPVPSPATTTGRPPAVIHRRQRRAPDLHTG